MENLKEHLSEKIDKNIENKKERLEELKEKLEVLKADTKVEEKLLEMENIPEDLKEDRKYLVQAMKHDRSRKKDDIEELETELEALKYKKKVLSKLDEDELRGKGISD